MFLNNASGTLGFLWRHKTTNVQSVIQQVTAFGCHEYLERI
ncbi:hypothetical protein AB2H94_26030 (plasmid) [Escherichia coli]